MYLKAEAERVNGPLDVFFICLILFAFEWRGHVVLACIQLSLKVYSI